MTLAVWDYVFLGGDLPNTDIPIESLKFVKIISTYHYDL